MKNAAAQREAEIAAAQEGKLTQTFQHHGFGNKTSFPGQQQQGPETGNAPATATPSGAAQRPEQESTAPAFKRDVFTPMGNG